MGKHAGSALPPLRRGLIAILRGIRPEETADIITVLVDCGFEAIEIPLNSPDPFRSIEIASRIAPPNVLIGAGTVLESGQVKQLHAAGGKLVVTPNTDPEVIGMAIELGMVPMPGVFTATEALRSVKAGARALKFFPASILGFTGINAIRAVLPEDIVIGAVGGIGPGDFAAWMNAGITIFGLGSSLYRPGMSAADIAGLAAKNIAAYDAAVSQAKDRGN